MGIINRSAQEVSFSFLSFLAFSCFLSTPLSATKDCDFPAIFNFGDSNSDTGGNAATFSPLPKPYGRTFFHKPVGRFCDGRLMIDFLAEKLGLPVLNAYLDALGANFTHGANFAEAGAGITHQTSIQPAGLFNPFSLDLQFLHFLNFKKRSAELRRRGGVFSHLVPRKEYFSKALYTFDIGHNDLGAELIDNKTITEVFADIPGMINTYSTIIKKIYNAGGRSFWIHNTDPMGCLPYNRENSSVAERDGLGCVKSHNKMAQYFNDKLKEAVVQLRKDLPLASLTYVDVYSARYALYTDPKKYGFEERFVECCGFGGKYSYTVARCGKSITTHSKEVLFVGSCVNPSAHLNWDGYHYTEAANKVLVDQISTGKFSDPPLPLRRACHQICTAGK